MAKVRLERLKMIRESKSFTDSLHAILTAAGLFDGPKYRLSGLTGMAFKFSVHERLLPLSVSAYGQWGDEHKPAVDNLGLLTVMDGGRVRHPTFRYYQREAIDWVKQSLERGIGVIYWLPEFGVIDGYDDEDRVFYVQDGRSDERHIVLYDNFGLNFTEFWCCQSFEDKIDIPYETMLLESFRLAVRDWNTPYKTLPNKDIASGRLAYDFLTQALRKGGYDEGGAVYILDSFLQARKEIDAYLREARGIWPELDRASELYAELAALIPGMEACVAAQDGTRRGERGLIGELTGLLCKAKSLEEQAIGELDCLARAHPSDKWSIIPRWGTHTPK